MRGPRRRSKRLGHAARLEVRRRLRFGVPTRRDSDTESVPVAAAPVTSEDRISVLDYSGSEDNGEAPPSGISDAGDGRAGSVEGAEGDATPPVSEIPSSPAGSAMSSAGSVEGDEDLLSKSSSSAGGAADEQRASPLAPAVDDEEALPQEGSHKPAPKLWWTGVTSEQIKEGADKAEKVLPMTGEATPQVAEISMFRYTGRGANSCAGMYRNMPAINFAFAHVPVHVPANNNFCFAHCS